MISNVMSVDPHTGVVLYPGNMEDQIRVVYEAILSILRTYDCNWENVYSEDIYTTDMDLLLQYQNVRKQFVAERIDFTTKWSKVNQLLFGLAMIGKITQSHLRRISDTLFVQG